MPARILVIDDEVDIRTLVTLILTHEGYTVVDAPDGPEGLALAAQGVDLIILDIMLPSMSGWDVCARLKADPATRDIPVIILTVRSIMQDQQRADQAQPDAFVSKPFERKDLLDTVRTLLAKHPTA